MLITYPDLEVPKHLGASHCLRNHPEANRNHTILYHTLCPLGDANWPERIVEQVVSIWRNVGLPDPRKQKAVEPFLIAFGGKKHEGEQNFSGVNWEKVIDYFQWEAFSTAGKHEKAKDMQDIAMEKYGHIFNHRNPYEAR